MLLIDEEVPELQVTYQRVNSADYHQQQPQQVSSEDFS